MPPKPSPGSWGSKRASVTKQVAHIRCRGGESVSPRIAFYEGVNSCRGAELAAGGGKACPFGCLGLEDCAKACPINAISFDKGGIREVKVSKCTGCGLCADACPRDLIRMVPAGQNTLVRCNSHYTGKKAVSLCKVACIGCKKCEKACDYDAIHVVDGVAIIDFEKCTDCGECAVVCPTDSIQVWTKLPGHPGKGEFVVPPKARGRRGRGRGRDGRRSRGGIASNAPSRKILTLRIWPAGPVEGIILLTCIE